MKKSVVKTIGRVLLWMAGIILALMVVLQIVLSTALPKKILDSTLGEYIEGKLDYSRLRVSVLGSFPKIRVSIDSLSLTYPHDRYALYDTLRTRNFRGEAGRSVSSDTLASVAGVKVSVNPWWLLRGKIRVSELRLKGSRAYIHLFDSTASNLDIFRFPPPKDTAATQASLPWLSFAGVEIEDTRAVLCDLPDTVFADVDLGRLFLKGNVRIKPGTVKIRRGVLEAENLASSGRFPLDTASFFLDTLNIREKGRRDFDLLLSARAGTYDRDLGEVNIPIRIKSAVALAMEREEVNIDLKSFFAQVAHIPLTAEGKIALRGKNTFIDAKAGINNADIGSIWARYGKVMLPSLAEDISTDMHLSLSATAKGEAGKNLLPAVNGSASIAPCSVSYIPYNITGTMRTAASFALSPDGMMNASVDTLSVDAPGLELYARASASDLMYGNPDLRVSARSFISMDEVSRYLPKKLGISGSGDLDLDIDAAARLKNIAMLKADLTAKIASNSLNLSLPGRMIVRTKGFAVNLNDNRKASRLSGDIILDRVEMRVGEQLAVRVKNMRNGVSMVHHSGNKLSLHDLSVNHSTDRVFINFDGGRIGVSGLNLGALARRRQAEEKMLFRNGWRRRRPDYLTEKDFRDKDIKISVDQSTKDLLNRWDLTADVKLDSARVISPVFPLKIRVNDLDMGYKDDNLMVRLLKAVVGSSDIALKGSMKGIGRAIRKRAFIKTEFDINSGHLNANEILAALNSGKKKGNLNSGGSSDAEEDAYEKSVVTDTLSNAGMPDSLKLFVLPANVIAKANLNVDKVSWGDMDMRSLRSNAALRERTIQFTNTSAKTGMGNIALDAYYSVRTKKDVSAGADIHLDNLTAEKIISLLPHADSLMPMLRSFKGNMGMDLSATAAFDSTMNVLKPSIDGVVRLRGSGMRIDDAGDLRRVTRMLLFRNKNIGDLGDLSVNAVIHDNKMQVFPFIFKADRYTLALNGQQNLDKTFDYHATVIRWPFLFRFGINLFGNFDKWKFRLHRPLWKNGQVPVFDEELDLMQQGISNSIHNVFKHGAGGVREENRRRHGELEKLRRQAYIANGGEKAEELNVQEQQEVNNMVFREEEKQMREEIMKELEKTASEIDAAAAALNEQYNNLFK